MSTVSLSRLLEHHLDGFKATHRLPVYQLRALEQYRVCRSAALGSHSQYCENGHVMGVWYNSCKRRGCPQCQSLPTERWLVSQCEVLLAETHHHWIFTLPHELLELWRYNRALMQDMLFKAVADTLKQLGKDTRYLGAQPAFLLTLHTWGRNLSLHPHLHCLIAHGGATVEGQWIPPRKSCLFPARVMMQLFRGKLLSGLKALPGVTLPDTMNERQCQTLLNKLGRKDWVVHCCKPYRHGKGVMVYLARYVKSGALKSKSLRPMGDHAVAFSYRSHRTHSRHRQVLSIAHFIQRMCDHIPQFGKPGLRYYGLYHPCLRGKLNSVRSQLGQPPVKRTVAMSPEQYMASQSLIPRCEQCHAPLRGLGDYVNAMN
ncbi:MAG: IS91 family transposase [Pseudomonadales bacterium]